MIPGSFQNPLLAEFQKVMTRDGGQSWAGFLAQLAKELEMIQHRQTKIKFAHQEDPVLAAIQRVLRQEQVQLCWDKVVYLGCSAGGNVALRTLFGYLTFPHIPIVIAMHHNPGFRFLSRLNLVNGVAQQPIIIENDMPIRSNEVYFVPGDKILGYHAHDRSFHLSPLDSKQRFRPLIDQVFSVAGRRFHNKTVGVIMSGMLNDGAAGLKDMFLNRGAVMIQAAETALFKDMPKAAKEAVPTAKNLSLSDIAEQINTWSRQHLVPRSIKLVFGGR